MLRTRVLSAVVLIPLVAGRRGPAARGRPGRLRALCARGKGGLPALAARVGPGHGPAPGRGPLPRCDPAGPGAGRLADPDPHLAAPAAAPGPADPELGADGRRRPVAGLAHQPLCPPARPFGALWPGRRHALAGPHLPG